MIWASDWARSANISAISVSGAMPPTASSLRESSRRLRMRSPSTVPPGWRSVTTEACSASSDLARSRNCVDFPEPSSPSNVMNKPLSIQPSLPDHDESHLNVQCSRGGGCRDSAGEAL